MLLLMRGGAGSQLSERLPIAKNKEAARQLPANYLLGLGRGALANAGGSINWAETWIDYERSEALHMNLGFRYVLGSK
jgi:hypothetical protein